MTFAETFTIHALWPRRSETPAGIARRIKLYIAYSKMVLPDDTRWHGWLRPNICFNIENEPDKLESYIAESISHDDDGAIDPEGGYYPNLISVRGTASDENISACINLHIGSGSGPNSFQLRTDSQFADKTDPRLVTYEAMRTTMLAAAFSFQPDWCEVGPTRLADYYDREGYVRPAMGLAWMIWFSPAVARLVTPPRYSYPIVEHFEDGSLFLATSKDTFDCGNATHLEQARAIHRQIDPLNYTLPFEGLSGRGDRVPPFPKL